MEQLRKAIEGSMSLTMSEMISLAEQYGVGVESVVLEEASLRTGKSIRQVREDVMAAYEHNLRALAIGLKDGESILLGTVASQLNERKGEKLFADPLLDKTLLYTLSAQVGNHCIGLRPCAGTGDSCPYAGFICALLDMGVEKEKIADIAALILKIGSLFRVGKITTGCNMEGFGAGAVCIAAAVTALEGGTPRQMEKAMVTAISPTIGVPCTPRVLVPALCATHIGGAVLIGMYAARMCMRSELEVNVPFDVMLAMASQVHVESGRHIVPTVVEFMEPFFKRKENVEALVDDTVKQKEKEMMEATLDRAAKMAKRLAREAAPITSTLGDAVVGGSSQAVGSPTNAGRIAHELARGKIKKVTVELYPELFARRSINIPGVLMGAVYGASTDDYEMYKKAVDMVRADGIAVDIVEGSVHGIQKITIETDEMTCMVDTRNRGGGRLVLVDASPSLDEARKAAQRLGIVVVK